VQDEPLLQVEPKLQAVLAETVVAAVRPKVPTERWVSVAPQKSAVDPVAVVAVGTAVAAVVQTFPAGATTMMMVVEVDLLTPILR
jgi:preprotein translocase subunit Sec61beta